MNEQITCDFESRLYKTFVLPGIALEVLLLFSICVSIGLNLNLICRPMGGPAGISASITIFIYCFPLTIYFLVAGFYSLLLPYKYYRRREKFILSARRFLVFSCVWIILMDVMIAVGFVEMVRWDLGDYMNKFIVFPLTALAALMTVVFFYWTRKVNKFLHL